MNLLLFYKGDGGIDSVPVNDVICIFEDGVEGGSIIRVKDKTSPKGFLALEAYDETLELINRFNSIQHGSKT